MGGGTLEIVFVKIWQSEPSYLGSYTFLIIMLLHRGIAHFYPPGSETAQDLSET
jgi:hypothetical protein